MKSATIPLSWRHIGKLLCICLFAVFPCALVAADNSIGLVKEIESEPTLVEGNEYYLRHCVWHINGVHISTNYTRGTLLPVNTKVKLIRLSKSKFIFQVESTKENVEIENVEKFSRRSMQQIAKNMLTPKPVSLEKYGKMADAIRKGDMKLGMTRDEVLLARGFPPGHKTPSLSGDRWMYWSSRMIIQTIEFENGKVVKGRGLTE